MTKYIDRYYLNWEVYGIKFAEPGWQPWANTLFYRPLTEDANDATTNNRNWTASANITFSSSNGAYLIWDAGLWYNSLIQSASFNMWTTYTINTWIKAEQTLTDSHEIEIQRNWIWPARYVIFNVDSSWFHCMLGNWWSSNWSQLNASFDIWTSWHNVCLTRSWKDISIYADWQLLTSWDGGYQADVPSFIIGTDTSSGNQYSSYSYFKDYIMEDKVRTAQEISNYYNQTKSLYGIS